MIDANDVDCGMDASADANHGTPGAQTEADMTATATATTPKIAKQKRAKAAKAEPRIRAHKTYAFATDKDGHVKPMPDGVGEKTVAHKVLLAIREQKGKGTFESIRDAVSPKPKVPTLRFYLGKFQRDKIVKSKA